MLRTADAERWERWSWSPRPRNPSSPVCVPWHRHLVRLRLLRRCSDHPAGTRQPPLSPAIGCRCSSPGTLPLPDVPEPAVCFGGAGVAVGVPISCMPDQTTAIAQSASGSGLQRGVHPRGRRPTASLLNAIGDALSARRVHATLASYYRCKQHMIWSRGMPFVVSVSFRTGGVSCDE
jgi:hypothetical protein